MSDSFEARCALERRICRFPFAPSPQPPTAPPSSQQSALRRKDQELDERAQLLLKTKAAIEQLQNELGTARGENERLRKVGRRVHCSLPHLWMGRPPASYSPGLQNFSCRSMSSRPWKQLMCSSKLVWWSRSWKPRAVRQPICSVNPMPRRQGPVGQQFDTWGGS